MRRTLGMGIALTLVGSAAIAAVTIEDIDVTDDRFVTFEEMMNAIPGMDMVDFKRIDTNSDNRLSADEINDATAQSVLSQHSLVGSKDRPLMLLDEDGDGFMDLADFQRVHPDFTAITFEEIDANGDNRVSYQEYYTPEAQTKIAQCGPSGFMDIASIDANKDNFADLAEVQAVLPKMGKSEFREIDLNNDNRLSAIEWLSPRARCLIDEHGS